MTRWSGYKMDKKDNVSHYFFLCHVPLLSHTNLFLKPRSTQESCFNSGSTRYSDFLKSHSGQCFQSNILFIHFKDLPCTICSPEPDCWLIKGREIDYTEIIKKMEEVTAMALPLSTQLEWETCIFPPSIFYVHRSFRMEWQVHVWWAFKPTYCWIWNKSIQQEPTQDLRNSFFCCNSSWTILILEKHQLSQHFWKDILC